MNWTNCSPHPKARVEEARGSLGVQKPGLLSVCELPLYKVRSTAQQKRLYAIKVCFIINYLNVIKLCLIDCISSHPHLNSAMAVYNAPIHQPFWKGKPTH